MAIDTILLIEDDESIREITKELLETEGYKTVVAANGQIALDILNACTNGDLPKVILLDLMMPVMDGWQFMEQKRLNDKLSNIPVVAFSALEERKISSARTDDVIRKPIHPEMMLKVIQKYCRGEH